MDGGLGSWPLCVGEALQGLAGRRPPLLTVRTEAGDVVVTVHNGCMRIELLHIDQCPNTVRALERLESALAVLGRSDIAVRLRQLSTASDIPDTGFAGSPTITVDGSDIFPTGAPADDLACRLYATPDGFAGLPTLNQIVQALVSRGF